MQHEMHARATALARTAMRAQPPLQGDFSDYGRATADYERRRSEMRAEGIARGLAHNRELHELSHIRKYGGYQNDLPF